MAFIFSTSHFPETRVRRPAIHEEEDEDGMQQPPPRAGGVRAFSHLPEPVRPQADSSGSLSTRPAPPVGRTRPYADPEADIGTHDADHAPGPDSDHHDEARARDEYTDDTPWHSPRITAQDQPPQSHDEDEYTPGPSSARDSSFDDAPPVGRSASRYRDTGSFQRPQDIRSDYHSPSAPDSSAWGMPAAQNHANQTRGLPFEKRSAQEALAIQQKQGNGSGGPSSQQRSQASQRAIAAPQQQARDSSPPAQDGRLIVQQPAPPLPPEQAPRQSGPTMPQNQGPDATKQGGGATPAKDGRDPLTILSEKFAAFPNAVNALKQLYTLPTGKLMIDKLATVADKIKIGLSLRAEGYMDGDVFRVRRDIDEFTLAHEFQHLGEMLFGDKNPFLKVEDPEDVKKYPNLTHYDKEFRAMRMQNQIRLERARMNKTTPFLHPTYYDKTGGYLIPGSRLPQQ